MDRVGHTGLVAVARGLDRLLLPGRPGRTARHAFGVPSHRRLLRQSVRPTGGHRFHPRRATHGPWELEDVSLPDPSGGRTAGPADRYRRSRSTGTARGARDWFASSGFGSAGRRFPATPRSPCSTSRRTTPRPFRECLAFRSCHGERRGRLPEDKLLLGVTKQSEPDRSLLEEGYRSVPISLRPGGPCDHGTYDFPRSTASSDHAFDGIQPAHLHLPYFEGKVNMKKIPSPDRSRAERRRTIQKLQKSHISYSTLY
jgi:hypothetical protein